MEELETLQNLDFPIQLKTIDICACGPLRVSASLINGGLLQEGSKIIMITSQGGSVSWRTTQNPTGHDYGHHVRFTEVTPEFGSKTFNSLNLLRRCPRQPRT